MLKLKGRYAYDLEYHKDPSALIVPKALKAVMVDGKDLESFIKNHSDKYDFMIRAKVPKANRLVMRWDALNYDQELPHIIRFYITKVGGRLINIKPQEHEIGQYKRANKITDEYFNQVMAEIGKDVWDPRIHTKNKAVYQPDQETGICAGYMVTDCSNADEFNWSELNYDWYIKKVERDLIL